MVYDTFCFFNELDLLEIRLNVLNDVVDRFVISESSVTHTGKPKPFYFEENKLRYKEFLHKIINVKVYDTPERFDNLDSSKDEIYRFINEQTQRFDKKTQIDYGRDFFQKETVRRGLKECSDFDVVMFSDCDEIPDPAIVDRYGVFEGLGMSPLTVSMDCYYYYVNVLKERGWLGTRIGSWKELKSKSFNELRASRWSIVNGGWHFSFMGGAERVKQKIEAYSAQEMNSSSVIASIQSNIDSLNDPFFRSKLEKVEPVLPDYLNNNREKYSYLWL